MMEAPSIQVGYGIRGYPLSAMRPTDENGRDFDSYDTASEHAEILTIPNWFPFWKGRVLWDGMFSCYYDIHIAIEAFRRGWRTGQNENVPDVPVLWAHKGHYWIIADIAYDFKRGSQGAIIGGAIALAGALKVIGWI
jgi:hypothetical protein